MGRQPARVILALMLVALGGVASAACSEDTVDIRTVAGAVQRFSVEVADDPAEQSKGLMFREKMASSAGMLFVFPAPKRATFWMKDTPLSLDMIFADQTGTVTRVHEKAIPLDTSMIDGGEGVALVLEINGGLAKPMGIGPGAVLRHPSVAAKGAVWPCLTE
jgi:uncharacterized protein